jgi:hypothetical protein
VIEPSDLDDLRQRFPAWQFSTVWATAASGPDQRRLIAYQGTVIVSAWEAAELAATIEREEAGL